MILIVAIFIYFFGVDIYLIRRLLAKGANPRALNETGESPLNSIVNEDMYALMALADRSPEVFAMLNKVSFYHTHVYYTIYIYIYIYIYILLYLYPTTTLLLGTVN
mgnify:CR=1 FL=1